MKNHEADIFIFIAFIIIGILIAMNISFSREGSTLLLSASQYADAVNTRNKLLNDISNSSKLYREREAKLVKYKYGNEDEEVVKKELKDELEINNEVLGVSAVKGPGIKIELNDASTEFVTNQFEYQLRVIHNTDVIQIINDIVNSGAEAIAINGQRIMDKSEVYCNGPFLRVNGIKIATPFFITAIGDKEVMKNYMLLDDNYLKGMILRKIKVDIVVDDNIVIPAYVGEIKHDFIKDVNKK